jgi:beta-lactam-binding protein with PASTA domain
VSRGAAAVSETVTVEDFTSYKAAAVLQWGRDNGVAITLTEAFDPYITAGNVISQSVKKGTEIKRTDSITVVISKGRSVTTANFTAMSKEEASSWARLHNVTLTFTEKYTNSHARGKIYSQSIAGGTAVAEGQEIKLSVSLGRVDVPSFIGRTRLDILSWQQDVNARGGSISLNFSEAYGDKGTAGTIISQSIKNDLVNTGTALEVTLSRGMRLVTPDFSGMKEEEVKTTGRDLGLKILFDYQYHSDVARGYVISQSVDKDTIISDADTLTVLISLGPNP